jgi:hypothetical protein
VRLLAQASLQLASVPVAQEREASDPGGTVTRKPTGVGDPFDACDVFRTS